MSKLIYPFGVLRVFFSLECNFNCGYCSMLNQKDLWKGSDFKKDEATPDQWIEAFDRIEAQRGLIVTPCNAEPALYDGCAEVVNRGLKRFQTNFYTNLSTESCKEMAKFDKRDNLCFYVSYHHGQIDVDEFIENAKWLQSEYKVINFHAPMYPTFEDKIKEDALRMREKGVLLDTDHEYLGMYKGEMNYSYLLDGQKEPGDWIKNRLSHRLEGTPKKKVLCKTSHDHDSYFSRAYTVAPDGDIYTCWRYLYNHDKRGVLGSFFDPDFQFKDEYFECEEYGDCNVCAWHKDIKDVATGEQLDVDTSNKVGKTISACMIVKNEEDTLFDCLASIDQWVDEIVIVDTGSTDKTKEVADQFDKVRWFHQPWEGDFSKHRNYSMEQATKDWIFIIDADERVLPEHGENLKRMLPDIPTDIIGVDLCNLYGQPRVVKAHYKALRFFRRTYKPEYRGRIHNRPVIKGESQVYLVPFQINHLGYDMPPDVMKTKYERTVKLCRQWTKEEPADPESWYQYVKILKIKDGKFNDEAVPEMYAALEKGLSAVNGNGDSSNINVQLLNLTAWVKHANGEHNEAIGYAKRALAVKPDYLDAILLIGMAYVYGVDAKEGEVWLQRYLREQEAYGFTDKLDGIVMEHMNERKLVYKTLMDIEGWKETRTPVKQETIKDDLQ